MRANTAVYRFVFQTPSATMNSTKYPLLFKFPSLGERNCWRDEGPQCKVGNGVDCAKRQPRLRSRKTQNGQCTTQPRFRSRDLPSSSSLANTFRYIVTTTMIFVLKWTAMSLHPFLVVSPQESSGLSITRAVSANQKVTNDISHEKPEEWSPCLAHKQKKKEKSNRAKDL